MNFKTNHTHRDASGFESSDTHNIIEKLLSVVCVARLKTACIAMSVKCFQWIAEAIHWRFFAAAMVLRIFVP